MKFKTILTRFGTGVLAVSSILLITTSCSKSDSSTSGSMSASSFPADSDPTTIQTTSTEREGTTASSESESSSVSESPSAVLPTGEGVEQIDAVFLGVYNYGTSETKKENADQFFYRFRVNGAEQLFAIDNSLLDENGKPAYPVQNKLKEGYPFTLAVKENVIIDVVELPREDTVSYTPVVCGTPGERTVMNFIKTSLMPVGTTLYVFGGGWDWQDTGSAIQARTLGVSDDWVRFFNSQDENYTFRDKDNDKSQRDPTTSYYPFGGYNEYYYAGLDCSGFVGWATYNTFETENGRPGYVCSSTKMAKRMAEEYGWGDFSQKVAPSESNTYKLRPGDVISMKGHVWISLGTCDDGSVLIVHSTNGILSKTGQPGGGVALGAIGWSKDCEAYQLADKYMTEFYPEWSSRYSVALSSPDNFFYMEGDTAGRFTWDTTSGKGLTDDLGAQNMKPSEILKYCYGEK